VREELGSGKSPGRRAGCDVESRSHLHPGASGYVEFHLYRKSIERLGIGLAQYDDDDDLNPPILQHVLHSLALAVGHPVPAERRPPALGVGDEGLALGEEPD
jgi:hypothetical protein